MKYRKKPVVVEAHQWDGSTDCMDDIIHLFPKMSNIVDNTKIELSWEIETLEGNHKVTVGDFIIQGVKGEFYPCKPDIFELTYEKVE